MKAIAPIEGLTIFGCAVESLGQDASKALMTNKELVRMFNVRRLTNVEDQKQVYARRNLPPPSGELTER